MVALAIIRHRGPVHGRGERPGMIVDEHPDQWSGEETDIRRFIAAVDPDD